jgi:hypothetical protein
VEVIVGGGADRLVPQEELRQLQILVRPLEGGSGAVAELVHQLVGRTRLLEAALPPAVHGRGLHRLVGVLAHDPLAPTAGQVADPPREEQVVVALGAALEVEPVQVGEQVLEDDRDRRPPSTLGVQLHRPGLEVDVAPAEKAQFPFPQPVPGHERDRHPVAQIRLSLDDRLNRLRRERTPAAWLAPTRP